MNLDYLMQLQTIRRMLLGKTATRIGGMALASFQEVIVVGNWKTLET